MQTFFPMEPSVKFPCFNLPCIETAHGILQKEVLRFHSQGGMETWIQFSLFSASYTCMPIKNVVTLKFLFIIRNL